MLYKVLVCGNLFASDFPWYCKKGIGVFVVNSPSDARQELIGMHLPLKTQGTESPPQSLELILLSEFSYHTGTPFSNLLFAASKEQRVRQPRAW